MCSSKTAQTSFLSSWGSQVTFKQSFLVWFYWNVGLLRCQAAEHHSTILFAVGLELSGLGTKVSIAFTDVAEDAAIRRSGCCHSSPRANPGSSSTCFTFLRLSLLRRRGLFKERLGKLVPVWLHRTASVLKILGLSIMKV